MGTPYNKAKELIKDYGIQGALLTASCDSCEGLYWDEVRLIINNISQGKGVSPLKMQPEYYELKKVRLN